MVRYFCQITFLNGQKFYGRSSSSELHAIYTYDKLVYDANRSMYFVWWPDRKWHQITILEAIKQNTGFQQTSFVYNVWSFKMDLSFKKKMCFKKLNIPKILKHISFWMQNRWNWFFVTILVIRNSLLCQLSLLYFQMLNESLSELFKNSYQLFTSKIFNSKTKLKYSIDDSIDFFLIMYYL